MIVTILFKSGKEVSVKCDEIRTETNPVTDRIDHILFSGVEENEILDLDFTEIAAIYRK